MVTGGGWLSMRVAWWWGRGWRVGGLRLDNGGSVGSTLPVPELAGGKRGQGERQPALREALRLPLGTIQFEFRLRNQSSSWASNVRAHQPADTVTLERVPLTQPGAPCGRPRRHQAATGGDPSSCNTLNASFTAHEWPALAGICQWPTPHCPHMHDGDAAMWPWAAGHQGTAAAHPSLSPTSPVSTAPPRSVQHPATQICAKGPPSPATQVPRTEAVLQGWCHSRVT